MCVVSSFTVRNLRPEYKRAEKPYIKILDMLSPYVEPNQKRFIFPAGLLCCFLLPSWLKSTRPPVVSPGPPGQLEPMAQTASALTFSGWQTTFPSSGCRAPTFTFSPHLTSSTRP